MIRVCVAGVSGWTGSEVAKAVLGSSEFELSGAVARRSAGRDAGELLGVPGNGVTISATLAEALARPTDVLIDYTTPDTVKARTLEALTRGVRVVIGTSGLTAADYSDIDYAHAGKPDAPSGTARELADALGEVGPAELAVPAERTHGNPEARGASVGGHAGSFDPAAGLRAGGRSPVRSAARTAHDPARRGQGRRGVCERNAPGCAKGDERDGFGAGSGPTLIRSMKPRPLVPLHPKQAV